LINNLLVYLYYTARPHIINPIFWLRLINEWYKKRKLTKNDFLWNHLSVAIRKSKSLGCEYSDYYFLYNSLINGDLINLADKNKDKTILATLDRRIGTYLAYREIFPKVSVKYNPIHKLTSIRLDKFK